MSVIEIKNLNKDYKMYNSKKARLLELILPAYKNHSTFRAINDMNLEVNKGEILGILGKNGAGKSTLLKMITGVVTPTSGIINVNGKISSLLELGAAFNAELTGLENIYQHGQVMGLSQEQIVNTKQDIIDFADIGDHLYQPVKTYSSGMFARLAFACAINVDPDILIVDEVLSVGDMAFQLKCFKKFEEFKKKGKTILFVTHSINDILRNCTRTIIIEDGTKIFDGSVKDGVEKYKKIIVGVSANQEKKTVKVEENNEETKKENKVNQNTEEDSWKKRFNQNPNLITYGNGAAEVVDYGMFHLDDNYAMMIENDKEIVLKSKVVFHKDVKDPIFTMTLKDFKGLEICGTNTVIEKIITGEFKKGDTAITEFRQTFNVAPGKYTLSFSCTHFNHRGDLEVLDRKYDALLVEVMSVKEMVGLLKVNSEVSVTKIPAK